MGAIKSYVDKRIATDDHIFKKLNKRMNGLDKALNSTPTIQNQAEAVMPDGTIAKTDEDIRVASSLPLRTPTGLLEYKEAKKEENFPIRVALTTEKYYAESFLQAVDTSFEYFDEAKFTLIEPPNPTNIHVLDNVKEIPTVETIIIDNSKPEEEADELKTASEVHGEEFKLEQEVNEAGALTGVSGAIWLIWKGIRYRFCPYNLTGLTVMPTPYEGLTENVANQNLEVFLKEHQMTYDNIDIVPSAELVEKIPIYYALRAIWKTENPGESITDQDVVLDACKWTDVRKDGFKYNKETVIYNGLQYEPGDIISITNVRKPKANGGYWAPAYVPDISDRWTEYHPFMTNKPSVKDLVYKPTARELAGKRYEDKVARLFSEGASQGYFIMIKGNWEKTGWEVINARGTYYDAPSSAAPETGKNNYSKNAGSVMPGYHGNSYIVLDWSQVKHIGTGISKTGASNVKVYTEANKGGTVYDLTPGTHSGNNIPNRAKSIVIPAGAKITLEEDDVTTSRTGDDYETRKTWTGPKTLNLVDETFRNKYIGTKGFGKGRKYKTSKWSDTPLKTIVITKGTDKIVAGSHLSLSEYNSYKSDSDYYRKEHIAPYNELFE